MVTVCHSLPSLPVTKCLILQVFFFCILRRLINTFTIICKYTRSFCSLFFLLKLDLCCCIFFLNANELVMYLHPVCLGEFVSYRYKEVELLHPRDMNTQYSHVRGQLAVPDLSTHCSGTCHHSICTLEMLLKRCSRLHLSKMMR